MDQVKVEFAASFVSNADQISEPARLEGEPLDGSKTPHLIKSDARSCTQLL